MQDDETTDAIPPRASIGELITADHQILNFESESIIDQRSALTTQDVLVLDAKFSSEE